MSGAAEGHKPHKNEGAVARLEEWLPQEMREPWAAVVAGGHEARIQRALFRVACGATYRQAAESEGYADHAALWRLALKHGIVQANKQQILSGNRRVAYLANQELERRLLAESLKDETMRDIVVAGGVAQDKIAKAEGWERANQDNDYAGALRDMAREMGPQGGKITLELTVEPREDDAVDVTPIPDDDEERNE